MTYVTFENNIGYDWYQLKSLENKKKLRHEWKYEWNQGLVNLDFDDNKTRLELMIIFQVWLGKTISKVTITKTNQAKEKSWRRRPPQIEEFFKTKAS